MNVEEDCRSFFVSGEFRKDDLPKGIFFVFKHFKSWQEHFFEFGEVFSERSMTFMEKVIETQKQTNETRQGYIPEYIVYVAKKLKHEYQWVMILIPYLVMWYVLIFYR